MDAINAIAARHGDIPVIEDAAQSFGATYAAHGVQRKSCHLSTIGCTSFFPSKPLGCYGDGGAIFTDDDDLALALRQIRVHGQRSAIIHARVGVGGRMDTLQCAIVLAKLERFEWEVERRQQLSAAYARQLASATNVQLLAVRPDRDCVWSQYTIMIDTRDAVQLALRKQGIPTAVHYPLSLNMQPAYRHLSEPDCTPNSHAVAERVLSLPMSADMTPEDMQRVVLAISAATNA